MTQLIKLIVFSILSTCISNQLLASTNCLSKLTQLPSSNLEDRSRGLIEVMWQPVARQHGRNLPGYNAFAEKPFLTLSQAVSQLNSSFGPRLTEQDTYQLIDLLRRLDLIVLIRRGSDLEVELSQSLRHCLASQLRPHQNYPFRPAPGFWD